MKQRLASSGLGVRNPTQCHPPPPPLREFCSRDMSRFEISGIMRKIAEVILFQLQSLYAQSPSDVKALLKIILSSKGKFHGCDIAPRYVQSLTTKYWSVN